MRISVLHCLHISILGAGCEKEPVTVSQQCHPLNRVLSLHQCEHHAHSSSWDMVCARIQSRFSCSTKAWSKPLSLELIPAIFLIKKQEKKNIFASGCLLNKSPYLRRLEAAFSPPISFGAAGKILLFSSSPLEKNPPIVGIWDVYICLSSFWSQDLYNISTPSLAVSLVTHRKAFLQSFASEASTGGPVRAFPPLPPLASAPFIYHDSSKKLVLLSKPNGSGCSQTLFLLYLCT